MPILMFFGFVAILAGGFGFRLSKTLQPSIEERRAEALFLRDEAMSATDPTEQALRLVQATDAESGEPLFVVLKLGSCALIVIGLFMSGLAWSLL